MKQKTKTKLKVGDPVEVIAGKDKGKRGKLSRILLKSGRAIVEGIIQMKRHTKPTQQNAQGGIVSKEASIHLSNIMMVDPKTDRPTRIAKKRVEGKAGEKATYVRVAKASGEEMRRAGRG